MRRPNYEVDETTFHAIRCYRIIRFYRNGAKRRVIRNNVTITEAQQHCGDPKTSTSRYFDGYDWMPGCRPKEE